MRLQEGLEKIIVSKSRSFLFWCGCFIFGIATFSVVETRSPVYWLFGVLLGCLFLLPWCWKIQLEKFILISVCVFLFGALRILMALPMYSPQETNFYIGQNRITNGRILSASRGDRTVNYIFRPDNWRGDILVSAPLYPFYNYGVRISLDCRLDQPEPFDGFRYDKYLLSHGIQATCYYPKINLLPGFAGSWWRKYIFLIKEKVSDTIGLLWPEPEAGLVAGLLYGEKSALPESLLNNFSRTGLTHIVAVSGYNTSLVVVGVIAGLIFIGFWRRQAVWLASGQLILFVVFTGASASVVRAAVMAGLVLLAERVGRISQPFNVLLITAAMMLLFNPLILFWDAGFQLSFLAIIGVSYIGPILSEKFGAGGENKDVGIVWPTLGAIVATAPLLAYQFGKVSLVAPLANVLVLWTIPFLMIASFAAVVAGFIWLPFGRVVAFVSHLGLRYVIMMVDWLGGWPLSVRDWRLPWWGMVVVYVVIIFIFARLRSQIKKELCLPKLK